MPALIHKTQRCTVTPCLPSPIQSHRIVQELNCALLADFAVRAVLSLPR